MVTGSTIPSRSAADIDATAAALAAMAEGRDATGDGQRSITEGELRNHGLLGGRGGGDHPKLTSPFEQVAVVNRCIEVIADAVKSMPLMISTADDRIVESGDVIDLLNQPYPGITGEDLIEWITALLPLTGSANLIVNDGDRGDRVTSLRPVGGDRVVPYYDDDGEVEFYRYSRPGGRRGPVDLTPDRVIRWTRSNYQSQRFADGLSALKPAAMAIRQVFGADVANLANLNSGIFPTLHISFPKRPTEDQVRDYRDHLREQHQSPARAGEPIITYDGASVEGLEKSFREMLHDRLRMMSIAEICVCLGVPPIVLGITGEGGLGHGKETQEAHTIFWQATVLPMAHWIARRMSIDVLPAFGGRSWRELTRKTSDARRSQLCCPTYRAARRHARGYRTWQRRGGRGRMAPVELFAWFDSSSVPAIVEAQTKLIEKGRVMIEVYEQPPADLIEAWDLPVPVHPHQHQATRPIGRVPVEEGNPLGPVAIGEADDADVVQEVGEDGRGRSRENTLRVQVGDVYARVDQRTLAGVWQSWLASWAGLRRKCEGELSRHWMQRRAECIRRAKEAFGRSVDMRSLAQPTGRRDVIGQILFEIVPGDRQRSLAARLGPLLRASAQLGGDQSMDEAAAATGQAKSDPYRIDDGGDVAQLLQRRQIHISSIEQSVRRRLGEDTEHALRQAVAEGLDSGESMQRIIETVRERFTKEGNKAAIVARTEVGAAVEEHRHAGRGQAGTPLKSWLSSRKETGRPNHLATEMATMDQPIANDELFTVAESGELALYPRDAQLTAGEIVNCACTTLARYPQDNLRSVIAGYATRGFLTADGKRSHAPNTPPTHTREDD